MGSSLDPSSASSLGYTGIGSSISAFTSQHVSSSPADSVKERLIENFTSEEGMLLHKRCSSESFLMEEQPFWFEELLSEPETSGHRGHQRSASDTYVYFGSSAGNLSTNDESKSMNTVQGTWGSPNSVLHKDLNLVSSDMHSGSANKDCAKVLDKSSEAVTISKQMLGMEQSGSRNQESTVGTPNASQSVSSTSKGDAKRAKQQSAHRSRIRKLQHISELESTVQILQVERNDMSAELEFLDQQNLILTLENRALKQRLDSLTQEHLIKQFEQEVLERELGRLQILCQLQRQHQVQLQQQKQQQQPKHVSRHRRGKSKDLETKFSNLSLQNNESVPSRFSINGSVRM